MISLLEIDRGGVILTAFFSIKRKKSISPFSFALSTNFVAIIDKNGKEFGRVIGEINFASKDFFDLMKKYN